MKKVELTPNKRIPESITVWQDMQPGVDLTMDLKNLTFQPESINELYVFNVLEKMFPEEIDLALKNWFKCLKKGGKLVIIANDFEFIARSFIGGDISIEDINASYVSPTQLTAVFLAKLLEATGFNQQNIRQWFVNKINDYLIKNDFEFALDCTK